MQISLKDQIKQRAAGINSGETIRDFSTEAAGGGNFPPGPSSPLETGVAIIGPS